MSFVFTLRVSYVQVSVCGMCGILSVLCAGFSVCYVQPLVCVMCVVSFVLCVVFSLCYVQFAVMSLVASLQACLASLFRAGPLRAPLGPYGPGHCGSPWALVGRALVGSLAPLWALVLGLP